MDGQNAPKPGEWPLVPTLGRATEGSAGLSQAQSHLGVASLQARGNDFDRGSLQMDFM